MPAKAHPVSLAVFFVPTAALMVLAMFIHGNESSSAAGVALLTTAFTAGTGAGILALGPLAIASTIAYERVGLVGLFAFALPLAILVIAVLQYIVKTRGSFAEIRRANDELRRSNADLSGLVEFAAGLAAHTHDSRQLAVSARRTLSRLLDGHVEVTVGPDVREGAMPLAAAGRVVGGLRIDGGDPQRWERLRDAIEPQLANALESTALAEDVRRTHLETIAALSRSMAAKDNYTSGHTERVSDIAVGLARWLGFSGPELDAIEIGALMHDIGKIVIPNSILHKPGPLDNDEWIVMKRHPVISELILSEIDLSPVVLRIVRSSHERMDGQGYPDGLEGEAIPMPARIVLVADAFDALTTDRPYRRARRPKAAIDEIVVNSGTQFCPQVVAALQEMYHGEPQTLGELALTVVAS
jgi:HD-GYP domain-containing protein (c-di-GMP phosphodiesterase class II)